MPQSQTEWYASWFDSEYYHILYKHRDHAEAARFISNLIVHLDQPDNSRMLDLGCGKGRHAAQLAEMGYELTGLDLSPESIDFATKNYPADNLEFYVHDMRNQFRTNYFDYIYSFFTTFGYFDSQRDNERMMEAVHSGLKQGGLFLIDFMNVHKVLANLVREEKKIIDGIQFDVRRKYTGKHIIKEIDVNDQDQVLHFTEKVEAVSLIDFEKLMEHAGLHIDEVWGDYDLNKYDYSNSDRLIIAARKR